MIGLLLISSPALAKKNDKPETLKPNIIAVAVNMEPAPGEVQVFGTDFSDPTISMGAEEIPESDVTTSGANELIFTLPADIEAGDYTLTVTQGAHTDEYDLTIGAVGPQGPAGADGTHGVAGFDCSDGTSCSVS